MTTPADFLDITIRPGASFLAETAGIQPSPEADVLMLAIGAQESGLSARVQANAGPAHGFWQFETEGVGGVLEHHIAGPLLRKVCARFDLAPDAARIWGALVYNDRLAYAVARLALWADPAPLPAAGDADGALAYYARVWRPGWHVRGEPEPGRWAGNYAAALAVVTTPAPEASA